MCDTYGEETCILKFGEKTERKRTIGKPSGRWDDRIDVDLKDIEWGTLEDIHPAQNNGMWQAVV
jgi:hypothetical protein